MDVEEVAAIYYIYTRYVKKKKQRKKYWVHPYLQTRDESKHFAIFFEELKKYEDKFFGFTRMSIKTFEELLNILEKLQKCTHSLNGGQPQTEPHSAYSNRPAGRHSGRSPPSDRSGLRVAALQCA
ncbi:hypothetical protein PYW07_009382 [Mythimna separata]|uniref:Protein ALP1-like n=1 Tax=Mythimna separata TaxID=271217 RepID=A0AAD8DN57_MYTSE|nr:hypothetical protein PYW07_009382 [Mythimna separata]